MTTPPNPLNEDMDPCTGKYNPCRQCGRHGGDWGRVPDLPGLRNRGQRRTITSPHVRKAVPGRKWTCTLCRDIEAAGYDTLQVYRWQVMQERESEEANAERKRALSRAA